MCLETNKYTAEECNGSHLLLLYFKVTPPNEPHWDPQASAPDTVPAAETAASAHIQRTKVGGRVVESDKILGNKTVPIDPRLDSVRGNCIRVLALHPCACCVGWAVNCHDP